MKHYFQVVSFGWGHDAKPQNYYSGKLTSVAMKSQTNILNSSHLHKEFSKKHLTIVQWWCLIYKKINAMSVFPNLLLNPTFLFKEQPSYE